VPEAENERLSATVPPGLLVADDRLRLEICANAGSQRQRMPQTIAHETTHPPSRDVEIINDKSTQTINQRNYAFFSADSP